MSRDLTPPQLFLSTVVFQINLQLQHPVLFSSFQEWVQDEHPELATKTAALNIVIKKRLHYDASLFPAELQGRLSSFIHTHKPAHNIYDAYDLLIGLVRILCTTQSSRAALTSQAFIAELFDTLPKLNNIFSNPDYAGSLLEYTTKILEYLSSDECPIKSNDFIPSCFYHSDLINSIDTTIETAIVEYNDSISQIECQELISQINSLMDRCLQMHRNVLKNRIEFRSDLAQNSYNDLSLHQREFKSFRVYLSGPSDNAAKKIADILKKYSTEGHIPKTTGDIIGFIKPRLVQWEKLTKELENSINSFIQTSKKDSTLPSYTNIFGNKPMAPRSRSRARRNASIEEDGVLNQTVFPKGR
jgi:hypothetical protein